MNIPRLVIGAALRGSGKSTVCSGLLRAYKNRGLKTAPFKKGPDYLDPLWLSAASGENCYNIDTHLFDVDPAMYLYSRAKNADIAIVEGNQGLHDSIYEDGRDSTASLSRILQAPLILVMNTSGANRTVAALVKGLVEFDPEVNFGGVILNNTRGPRHTGKIISAIETYTGIEILGSIEKNQSLEIEMRHLGLTPFFDSAKDDLLLNGKTSEDKREQPGAEDLLNAIARSLEENVNLDRILEIAQSAEPIRRNVENREEIKRIELKSQETPQKTDVTIAVAKDEAFYFYYHDNFDALKKEGARIIFFSPIHDEKPPEADAIYLGGGYPEVYAKQLEKNILMKQSIRSAAEKGMPIFAECGGLIYLSNTVEYNNETYEMTGAVQCDFVMTNESQARGYVEVKTENPAGLNEGSLWNIPPGVVFKAHEFHYTVAKNPPEPPRYAFTIIRGKGITGKHDGYLYKNILAGYIHIHCLSAPWWAPAFTQAAQKYKNYKNS